MPGEVGGLIESAFPAPGGMKRHWNHPIGAAQYVRAARAHEGGQRPGQRSAAFVFQGVNDCTERALVRADRAGTYRGVCAEFCGYQHAHMALLVIAEAPDAYAAWAERQRQPAAEPADDAAKRGRDVFLTSTCAMCHAVDGTTAQAQRAPNLTHVASRRTIAAGTLANSPANRAAWIADPQAIKPGANMPPHALRPEDARALFAYVDTLQ